MTASLRLPLFVGSLVMLVACGAQTEPPSAEETTVEPTPSASPAPGTDAVGSAVGDLASTLAVDPASVEVVSVEEVTWRDGSRGCAQPGMAYTQALIDGSRITLRADGRTYEYHSGGGRPPTRCEKPTE
ncbi:hypothetical protein SAMN05192575_10750 [Nocardioides alpinus]|uniref:Uncharacterized protein n=1 Tax=Nocardioides alpinus TaxID=748909 RepID=A0A1I0ZYL6_9ACTN|nr:hypothetical protein [Nocardioides alpinus]PKH42241.1 hypothetical protein CXG46_07170 [Nocardioides alpinus]SFB30839.1 hypothetical protein SAMN05192575_10750 [Nocardioides alpinus]